MNRFATRLATLLLGFLAVSCADDRFEDPNAVIGDGEAEISVTAAFKTYDEALTSSRSDGNSLDGIDNLTVLVYDGSGEFMQEKYYAQADLTIINNNDTPSDGSYAPKPDLPTEKTTFTLPDLPYGKYKIYVVANADLTGKDYTTEDNLKEICFEWSERVTENKQMFGWFSTTQPTQSDAWNLNAPVVVINEPRVELNAWLVRLASKVTVAYDATKLNEGVTIYLTSVQLKDIPRECTLGITNTPDQASQLTDGEIITYYAGTIAPTEKDFTDEYPARLVRGSKYGYDVESSSWTIHEHASEALFFYENCQGEGKNKAQDAVDNNTTQTGDTFNPGSGSPDHKIDFPDGNNSAPNTGYKDEKRFGTYIEVTAYYSNDGTQGEEGNGKIVYRFMLGQNITTDYNALRNYHYKLTLQFKGNANDVDWHIDYTPDPEITLPNPYFISYLYDKMAVIPVEIAGELEPGSKLSAKIIENGWWPGEYNTETGEFVAVDPQLEQYYGPGNERFDYTNKVWNGFLSLRNTGNVTDISPGTSAGNANAVNEAYWIDKKRGEREYKITDGTYNDDDAGEYSVETDKKKNLKKFNIPYFTRAKNLVKASGYTGNNPYVSYQRHAIVRFTAKIKSPIQGKYVDYSKDVEIIQVRRIVNPKGIWRAYNEDAEFNVNLMRLETEFTTNPWVSTGEFQTFTSIGPWSAEVMVEGAYKNGVNTSEQWIKLNGAKNNKITGDNGTEIKFTYQPDGVLTNENDVRYGVIKVRYHNYTCEHLIFVRQGYAPIPVSDKANATKWYSFNLQSATEMASSPLDEGSLFKRFKLDVPIRPQNNIDYPFQKAPGSLAIHYKPIGAENTQWSKNWTSWYTPISQTSFGPVKITRIGETIIPELEMKVASVDDYLELYNDANVQYGFGVCYDGTATEVKKKVKDAYSYYGKYVHNHNGITQAPNYEAGRGMRGCFVYNEKTGAQVFLPIGAAGYGRRKQNAIYPGPFDAGDLIYANRNQFMQQTANDVPWNRPILWDVYRRPGAIYWCNETKAGKVLENEQAQDCVAWDFNYITFDFFPISIDNVITYKGGMVQIKPGEVATDALRVRCVVPKTAN